MVVRWYCGEDRDVGLDESVGTPTEKDPLKCNINLH